MRSQTLRMVVLWGALVATSCKDGKDGDTGPAGDQGPAGEKGPQGAPGEPGTDAPGVTASLLALLPSAIEAGQTSTITLLGQNTAWDATTTVDLGAGVVVESVTAGSPTWLTATVIAGEAAELGARDVTVTTGDQALSLPGALQVGPMSEEMTINVTTLAAGAWAAIAIRAADPLFDQFTIVDLCDGDNPGEDGACNFLPGIASTPPTVVDPHLVYFVARLDLFLLNSNLEVQVTTRTGRHVLPVPVTETVPDGLSFGEAAAGDLAGDNTMGAYAIEVVQPGSLTLDLVPAEPDVFRHPHLEIFDLGSGIFARKEIVGSQLTFVTTNPGTYYVVVSDDWTDGRVAGGAGYSYSLTATGQPFVLVYEGNIEVEEEVDRYTYQPAEDTVLTIETLESADPTASIGDTIVRILDDADVELASNDDIDLAGGNYYSRIPTFAFTAGQTYTLSVEGYCDGFFGCAVGEYTLVGY